MCFGGSSKMSDPPPPPPPPPPPTKVASIAISTKNAKRKSGGKSQRGTLALTRGPKMGGSYVGTGINLNK